jgi:NAD(P)H-dependent FMN reductase
MVRIGIIIGSTRPGRIGEAVGKWAHEVAQGRTDAEFELIDLADQGLPLLDEPIPPSQGKYSKEHTKRWAAVIEPLDGFVFVTPEYNHGTSAALKNALDFLYKEWNNKAAGFVGYGSMMGSRAVESLRITLAELQVATVRSQVGLSLFTDFEEFTRFKPDPRHETALHAMLDQLVPWAKALKGVRDGSAAEHGRPRPGSERSHGRAERPGAQANA